MADSHPSPFAPWRARLDAAERRVVALVSPMHAAARRRRPNRDRWCVDEIVDHLARTVEMYVERVDSALTKAKARGPRTIHELKHRAFGRFLIKALAPGSRPVPAPKIFRPRESSAGESAAHDAMERFRRANEKLRAREGAVEMKPARPAGTRRRVIA